MPFVLSKDRLDVVFIYHGISGTGAVQVVAIFKIRYNFLLINKGYLAVWNHRGEEKGVGFSAYRAFESDDF